MVLAEAISDVHNSFHLQDKVVRTTTDNGSNFVKSFVQFSTEADVLPIVPGVDEETDPELNEPELVQLMEGEDPVEFFCVEDALEEAPANVAAGADAPYHLPMHMRCAAHTFNLVASVDSDKALANPAFKTACRKAMGKAQALWNAQTRSTQFADAIQDECGKKLRVPNTTRWNSVYDAVYELNKLLDSNRQG